LAWRTDGGRNGKYEAKSSVVTLFAQPHIPSGPRLIATTPVPGTAGIDPSKIHGALDTLSAEDIARGHSASIVDM
jgi:hypothetical protein